MSTKFYKKGGPAYLFIGGESAASSLQMDAGYWAEHGRKKNAALFLLEHRCYGASRPTRLVSSKDCTTLSLKHLL